MKERVIMTEEYLQAKADLCETLAREDINAGEIARAIKNLERANLALYRLGLIKEGESDE
jgi:hypothetical protein